MTNSDQKRTMKAVRIHQRGGPDVMKLEEIPIPTPRQGEVLIKVAAAGVNYADIGQRTGAYPNQVDLPTTLGNEAVGIVVAQGPGVQSPGEGTRVVSLVDEGYAEYALAKADMVIPIPDHVTFAQATVIPIQGESAYLLLEKASRFQQGERVLVHAAAGGVGSLVVQLAKLFGASMVIGTTTTSTKSDFIRSLGADVVINSKDANWVEQVMQATQGRGVDIVLDSVGGQVGQQSIACLAVGGRMVVYGSLTGEPTPIVTQMLVPKYQTVTGYNTLVQSPEDKMRSGQALMQYIATGQLKVILENTFPLEEAAAAQQAVEEKRTRGKVVLTVGNTGQK